MAPDDLDRNLLFGVLALKADVFDAPRFTKFCAAWAGQKETSLADWLVKRGWISVEDRIAVDHLVELKVRKHGSVQIGLADAMDAEVMQALQNVDDTKIRRFATGLAVLGEPERARSVAPVAETLYTATKPQLTGPGNEIAASAMVRGSIPLTEGDQLQLPRQRRGLFRILATVGATTVVLNDATIGILDPYAVWRKVPGSRLATERRDGDTWLVSLDSQCHVAQAVRKPLEPPQPAANGHLELEGFNLPPARQAAVRFKGAG